MRGTGGELYGRLYMIKIDTLMIAILIGFIVMFVPVKDHADRVGMTIESGRCH